MAEKIPTALGVENSDLICELLAGLETKDVVNEDEVVLTLEPVKSQDTMEVGCKWLNDEDINKVMELIKKQFPLLEGLHNCLIGHSYRSFPKTDGAFIQILHINGNHWITVQHEPQSGFVHVYDSMYSSTSFDAKRQIAALLRMKDRQIELKIQPVQYQKGCTDCGVFAVAFATDLAHGCNPSEHQYNQDELRSHFHKCLREVKMTPFPSTQQTPGRPKTEYIEVFCTCRLPANNLMVQCSECKEKYHTSCISTSPSLHCKCSTNACNIENERVTMEDTGTDGLSPNQMDLMNKVGSVIPAKWRVVGMQLGLSANNLDDIHSLNAGKSPASQDSFQLMLSTWKQQGSSPYTWKTIIDALRTPSVGEVALADELSNIYWESSSQTTADNYCTIIDK